MPDETLTPPPADSATVRPPADTPADTPVAGPAPATVACVVAALGPSGGPAINLPGYELVDLLGKGGMGVVYRATDTAFGRDVAVKVLADDFPPDGTSARRFLEEARITGQLQHPGIPAVHQAGSLPDGRPFLAMKLIKGRTLQDLLADRPDPGAERGRYLAIFEQVCQAVGYAHSRGVIHRDLKPSNVMVGAFGEVQVMDWGLAKVLAGGGRVPTAESPAAPPGTTIRSLRSAAEETDPGAALGTPAYMSPEQATGAVAEMDARTDVFGLGAVLCTVLTGRPPYLAPDSGSTWRLAARAKLADAYDRLDASGAEPDLVSLAKRCLAAERADRPLDAGEVAAAVAAMRTAAEDRARRAEVERATAEVATAEERRRRRVQLVSGSAVLATLVIGGGLALAQWQRAERAFGQVTVEKGEKETALGRVTEEQKKTVAALVDLQNARDETIDALRKLTGKLIGERVDRQPAVTDRDRQFFRDVLLLWEKVAAKRADGVAADTLRAEGALRVGLIRHGLGEAADAERAYRAALAAYELLANAHPAVPEYQYGQAAVHNSLGILFQDAGRPKEADAAYRAALAAYEKLAAEHPAAPEYRDGLARGHTNLGTLLAGTGRPKEAEAAYRAALAAYEKLAAEHPAAPEYQRGLVTAHTNLSNLLTNTGRPEDAEPAYRAALAVWKKLVAAHPDAPEYQYGLAAARANLGTLLAATGRQEDAERVYRTALTTYEKLAVAHPAAPEYRDGLARGHTNLGTLLAGTRRPKEAEAAYRAALSAYELLVKDHPAVPEYRDGLARSHTNLGTLFANTTRPADAEWAFQAALAIRKQLVADFPGTPDYQNGLANTLVQLATWRTSAGRHHEARGLLRDAGPCHHAALAAGPSNPTYRQVFRNSHFVLCHVLLALGDHASVPAAAAAIAEYGTSPTDAYVAGCYLAQCVLIARADADLATRYADQAMAHLRDAVRRGFSNAALMRNDGDLVSLRNRMDFRQLLAKLDGKPVPREAAPRPRPAQ